MKFHFITVLWGREFTELYLNTVLPTQLSPGNLPSMKDCANSIYKIYTTEEDYDEIKKSRYFSYLLEFIKVEPIFIHPPHISKKYEIMTQCHKNAIEYAEKDGALLVFLAPDAIFSDGSFYNLIKYSTLGKRAVMVAGLRVIKEEFVPELKRNYFLKDSKSVTLYGRDLLSLAIKHLHPISKDLIWDQRSISTWPSHIYWKIGDEGILVRGFHLHPLMVRPCTYNLGIESTIDGDFLLSACPDIRDIYVVTDSDEMMAIEMSSLSQYTPKKRHKSGPLNIALWAYRYTNRYHREFFRQKIKLHFEDDLNNWKRYEQESDRVVKQIMFYLKYGKLLFKTGMFLKEILKRLIMQLIGPERLIKIRKRFSGYI